MFYVHKATEYQLFPAKIWNVHYRHKTWEKEHNGPSALPPFKSQRQLYMQGVYDNNIIPRKVISANCVLNCLNQGIKLILRPITKFQFENEKFGASGCRQNLFWQTVRHQSRRQSSSLLRMTEVEKSSGKP